MRLTSDIAQSERTKGTKSIGTWFGEHQADVSKVLFLCAGLYGIVSVRLYPPQFGPPVEIVTLAMNIAAHGSISNPFWVLPTGPTAVIPPLYPLMLGGLIKLFHNLNLVYLTAMVGSILANAATAALLPRLSFLFYRTFLPGVVASLLWIPAMPIIPSYDVSFTILGIVVFCLTVSASIARNDSFLASVSGVVAGLVYLFNPATVLVLVPWIAFVCWRGSVRGGLRLKIATITFAVLLIFVVGWGWRNYIRLGVFGARTALGMTLYASDNDCAQVDIFRDQLYGCYDTHHPNTSLEEATLLRDLGEVKYDQKRIADVKQWVYLHPQKFASLTAKRVVAFWFPVTMPSPAEVLRARGAVPDIIKGWIAHRNQVAYAIRVITALSLPGLLLMLYRREPVALYVITVLGIYPLVYYVVISDVRFRYPVLWLSLLPAGYFVSWILQLANGAWLRRNVEPSSPA